MASGALSLTTVRLLGPHLTPENHETVLNRAASRSRTDIEALVAELNPQPDVPATVRKLPASKGAEPQPRLSRQPATGELLFATAVSGEPSTPRPIPPMVAVPRVQRPVVRASAPERYRVQFTIGRESHDKLRRVQALLRREIPGGDTGVIFERALALLLEKVEKEKLGSGGRPRRVIRPETDKTGDRSRPAGSMPGFAAVARSRHVPKAVKGTVWRRDGAQCAFVGPSGTRCTERSYLEFHHVQPFAREGPATAANISLRCRRHNQYEAELDFGPWGSAPVSAGGPSAGGSRT